MPAQLCIHELHPEYCGYCNPKLATPDTKRGRPSLRHTWADAIFDQIPADGETPISADDLVEATGLTKGQVAAGVAYLRDQHPEFPLLSSRDGYQFSIDPEAVIAFQRWRARAALTTMRRLWTGAVKPYLNKTARKPERLLITKQFERLLEDLADVGSET